MAARKAQWLKIAAAAKAAGWHPKRYLRQIRVLESSNEVVLLRTTTRPGARQPRFEVNIDAVKALHDSPFRDVPEESLEGFMHRTREELQMLERSVAAHQHALVLLLNDIANAKSLPELQAAIRRRRQR